MEGLKKLAAYMISLKTDDKNVVDTYVAAVDKLPVIGKIIGDLHALIGYSLCNFHIFPVK